MASDPTPEPRPVPGNSAECREEIGSLRIKAERCRRLAAGVSDKQAADVLKGMARNYQDAADRLDGPISSL